MNTLCIYYDLNDPQHQYNTLINYLEQFKGYAQAGSRVWFVNSDKDCKTVRDDINELGMPEGDRIIVFKVGNDWQSHGLKPETANWIKINWLP